MEEHLLGTLKETKPFVRKLSVRAPCGRAAWESLKAVWAKAVWEASRPGGRISEWKHAVWEECRWELPGGCAGLIKAEIWRG